MRGLPRRLRVAHLAGCIPDDGGNTLHRTGQAQDAAVERIGEAVERVADAGRIRLRLARILPEITLALGDLLLERGCRALNRVQCRAGVIQDVACPECRAATAQSETDRIRGIEQVDVREGQQLIHEWRRVCDQRRVRGITTGGTGGTGGGTGGAGVTVSVAGMAIRR